MWHDVETTKDLLNFNVVAKTAAQLIRDSEGQPLSIGISGNWGTGKSSLVKMIGASLMEDDSSDTKYLFIEFNAWLYQGYDDARMALLQTVADSLLSEAEKRETCIDKVQSFIERINWFRVGKLAAPVVAGAAMGSAVGGPVGAVVGAVGGLFKGEGNPTEADLDKFKEAYAGIEPQLKGLLQDKKVRSLPKEIAALRDSFAEILEDLDITLVVLVDDLDRCLPPTAISTLEAMRLLLFLPRTAFIIAADEQMIRNAVRSHFGDAALSDDLVTSYFDKLIQIPMRVPRLGVTEVKAYLMLLLADLARRRKEISKDTYEKAQVSILEALNRSWTGGLSRKMLEEAYGDEVSKVRKEIDLADQLAPLMATADHIAGNPRLIKRFLNNLLIRETIAKSQGMTLSFEELVKMQLFERCASPAAFEFLAKEVTNSDDGKPGFISDIESGIASGAEYVAPDKSWENSFITEWLKIDPPLADIDLRPLLHLSRDRAISLASYDELSPQAQELLAALIASNKIERGLIKKIQTIGEKEAERILNRLSRRARNDQFDLASIKRALHIPQAFPQIGSIFVSLLSEIPSSKRKPSLIPLIKKEEWAQGILAEWMADEHSPKPVRNAISKL
jgi:predicted KAP-like P-loop ATPase